MSTLRQRKSIIDVEETPQKPFFRNVSAIDMFPKPKEDFRRTQTSYGALISVVTVALIGLLVLWEVGAYIIGRDAYRTELSVDDSVSKDIVINLDITFPNVQCHEISLSVLDVTGTFKLNVTRNILKTPMTASGERAFFGQPAQSMFALSNSGSDDKKDPGSPNYCGDCLIEGFGNVPDELRKKYEKMCCNTCDDVMKTYSNLELLKPDKKVVRQCWYDVSLVNPGCNYKGAFKVRKVSGTLFFSPKMEGNTFLVRDLFKFDSSHTVNKFIIGDEKVVRFSRQGVHYPLNGHQLREKGPSMAKYFLKVVPTSYIHKKQKVISGSTYEYGVHFYHRRTFLGYGGSLPSVSFQYDFYPIQVNNHFERPPFFHFLVQLCGIAGGLFVVLGLVDRLVMHTSRLLNSF